jgi:hypothetical protein
VQTRGLAHQFPLPFCFLVYLLVRLVVVLAVLPLLEKVTMKY